MSSPPAAALRRASALQLHGSRPTPALQQHRMPGAEVLGPVRMHAECAVTCVCSESQESADLSTCVQRQKLVYLRVGTKSKTQQEDGVAFNNT